MSHAERTERCPGSFALDHATRWNRALALGLLVHSCAQRITNGDPIGVVLDWLRAEAPGDTEALDLVIDLYERDEFPPPDRAAAEVAFAMDPTAGTARELHRKGDRDYSMVSEDELAGTADVVMLEPDQVVVEDYKTGHGDVTPAAANLQLGLLAVAAARSYGRTQALVRIKRSRGRRDEAQLDGFALEALELRAAKLHRAAYDAVEARAHGEVPPLQMGPWCDYCAAQPFCPAQTGLARAAAGDAEALVCLPEHGLTSEQAAAAFEVAERLRRVAGAVMQQVEAYASKWLVHLSDGRVLGPVLTQRRELSAEIAKGVIADLVDFKDAEIAIPAALETSTSQAAVRRALSLCVGKGQAAKTMREFMRLMEERGGVTVKTTQKVRPHVPGANAEEE